MAGFLTADEAFANTNRILKIQPEWLSQILSGTKRIEIRNSKSPHKGWISLAETGSKRILGRANLIESHPVTEAERLQNAAAIEALQNYKEHWAWVLSDVEVLPAPIPIPDEVAHGCVRWVTKERWLAWEKKQTPADSPGEDADGNARHAEMAAAAADDKGHTSARNPTGYTKGLDCQRCGRSRGVDGYWYLTQKGVPRGTLCRPCEWSKRSGKSPEKCPALRKRQRRTSE